MMPQKYYRNIGVTSTADTDETTERNTVSKIVDMERSFLPTARLTSSDNDFQKGYYFYEDIDADVVRRSKSISIPKLDSQNITMHCNDYSEAFYTTTSFNDSIQDETIKYQQHNDVHDRYTLATWRMYDRIMQYRATNQNVSSSLASYQSEPSDDVDTDKIYYYNGDEEVRRKNQEEMWSPDCAVRQCYIDLSRNVCHPSDFPSIPSDTNYCDEIVFDLDL
jgi:hypothetical protein